MHSACGVHVEHCIVLSVVLIIVRLLPVLRHNGR